VDGNAEVIELLNEVLTAELTAINQYFIDAKMCENWGYDRLGKRFYKESIDEMKDAETLIERILYLEGVGEDVPEKLTLALVVEKEAVARLRRGIELCYDRGDHGSRDMLEKILNGEESHADWLETQLGLIASLGAQLYLSQQLDED
jgi:bacterioferritin